MNASKDAKAHLANAKEFLAAANQANEAGLHNAATSNAVWSGTHSKSAICLHLTGKTGTRGNAAEDLAELRASGGVGLSLADTFEQLLRAGSGSDAGQAIGWAGQLLEAARREDDNDVSDADRAPDGQQT